MSPVLSGSLIFIFLVVKYLEGYIGALLRVSLAEILEPMAAYGHRCCLFSGDLGMGVSPGDNQGNDLGYACASSLCSGSGDSGSLLSHRNSTFLRAEQLEDRKSHDPPCRRLSKSQTGDGSRIEGWALRTRKPLLV